MGALQFLKGIAYGAGFMYVLNPDSGRRRRAILLDKITSSVHHLGDGLEIAVADTANRLEGFWCEIQHLAAPRAQVPDSRLKARVLSRLGRVASHPRAVEVQASNGRIVLRGLVLREELEDVLSAVASVRGVTVVDNQLQLHDQPGDVPGPQGEPRHPRAAAQVAWTPTARLAAAAAGTVLMFRCARNPTPLNVLLGTAGFGLFTRAATNVGPMPRTEPAEAEEIAVAEE
jgi:hypothetical protein